MVLLHHIIPSEQEREEEVYSKSWCVPYVDEKGNVKACTMMSIEEEEGDVEREVEVWFVDEEGLEMVIKDMKETKHSH